MARPDLLQVPSFFHHYIDLVAQDDLIDAFREATPAFISFLEEIPPGKYDYRYAEGKWTVKQVLQHIIDAERIFSYRALRLARKDQTPLPGFEENDFAANAKTENRDWHNLVEEFKAVRKSSELLLLSLDEDQLHATGTVSGHRINALALFFIIIGHCTHHLQITRERYL